MQNGGSWRQLAKASSMPGGAFEGKGKKKTPVVLCNRIEIP
jgi:hypothetical protein